MEEKINLATVDWNNFTQEDFVALHKKLSENNKQKPRKKRSANNEMIVLTLRGNKYLVSKQKAERLRNLTSEKSKQKLINEIIMENNPIIIESL